MKFKFCTFSLVFSIFLCTIICGIVAKKADPANKPDWAKKDIRDFTDVDMERLLDQWEEDEEPLEPDELPEHLQPSPKIDFTKLSGPEEILKASKKGKTLMAFVSVSGDPTRDETERITKLWQTSLWNNHIQAERFLVDDNRAIFMYKDGSQAWDAKDFLIEQDRCLEVSIEQQRYPGKHHRGTVEKVDMHKHSDEL